MSLKPIDDLDCDDDDEECAVTYMDREFVVGETYEEWLEQYPEVD